MSSSETQIDYLASLIDNFWFDRAKSPSALAKSLKVDQFDDIFCCDLISWYLVAAVPKSHENLVGLANFL